MSWKSIETAPKTGAHVIVPDGVVFWQSKPNYYGQVGWHWYEDHESQWYSQHVCHPELWFDLPPAPGDAVMYENNEPICYRLTDKGREMLREGK